jgi:hypothetical protein
MMTLNYSPKIAQEMAVIHSCKNLWRILMKHGRNIMARQTRMRGTTSGMSHGYKEERILVGCVDVSCCALSLFFFFFNLVPNYARLIGEETIILSKEEA